MRIVGFSVRALRKFYAMFVDRLECAAAYIIRYVQQYPSRLGKIELPSQAVRLDGISS
jgi:hypothetical protein